ncbi:hypothetical protein PFISCL1PPCAC_18774, partial [Pristionchus fissidentatus]
TVLNAEPYVLSTDTEGDTTFNAIAAGFDAFDTIDRCTSIMGQYSATDYHDVKVWIRSPLITLAFNYAIHPLAEVSILAAVGAVDQFDLDKSAFVASPGYIGCDIEANTAS